MRDSPSLEGSVSFTGTAASKLDGLAFCVYAHKLPVCTTEFRAQQVFFVQVTLFC